MPAPAPSSCRVIALMNQKGGVGKTTTTVNLAAAIAELGGAGKRVLVIDLDPQAHASLHLGVDPAAFPLRSDTRARSVYDLLADPTLDAAPAIRAITPNLSVLPAETDLAGLETELSDIEPAQRTTRLRAVIDRLAGRYDYVLIDCPPSLGVLTLNGLAAAREVLIPMQAHFLALQGVSKLLETVQLVGRTVNPHLTVAGVVLCMHDPASSHVKEVVQDMVTFFEAANASAANVPWKSAKVYQPPVRRNIKLAECPSFGQTIFQYAPFCPGALDYKALAAKISAEWPDSTVAPSPASVAAPPSTEVVPAAAAAPVAKPTVTTRRPVRGGKPAETGA